MYLKPSLGLSLTFYANCKLLVKQYFNADELLAYGKQSQKFFFFFSRICFCSCLPSCCKQQLFSPVSFAHFLASGFDPLGHVPHVILGPEGDK